MFQGRWCVRSLGHGVLKWDPVNKRARHDSSDLIPVGVGITGRIAVEIPRSLKCPWSFTVWTFLIEILEFMKKSHIGV